MVFETKFLFFEGNLKISVLDKDPIYAILVGNTSIISFWEQLLLDKMFGDQIF